MNVNRSMGEVGSECAGVVRCVLGDEICPSISRDRTGFIPILTLHVDQDAFPARVNRYA